MSVEQTSSSSYNIFIGSSNESIYTVVSSQIFDSEYNIFLSQQDQSVYSIVSSVFDSSNYNVYVSTSDQSEYEVNPTSVDSSRYTIYLTRTINFNSDYFITASAVIESNYDIYVSRSNDSPYEIDVSSINQSNYYVLIRQENQSIYEIDISAEDLSKYNIPVTQRSYSEYKILEIFHPTVISTDSYNITNYSWISIPNQSRYGIEWSGLTSTVERYLGISEPYVQLDNDRSIFLQLYIRHTDDRTLFTSGYRTVPDERKLFVVREQLQSERYAIYERYYIDQDNRTNVWSGYFLETDERKSVTDSFLTTYSNRYTICEERETLDSDRQIFTLCIWNSFRHIVTKYWWPSERKCISGYCIPFKTYGDQRTIHAQIHTTKLDVIRTCFTESCSFTYNLTINPKYQDFSCGTVEDSYRELFSSTVVPLINNFYNIPVDWFYSEHDLIIIKYDGSWWTNIGETPASFMPVDRLTENTFIFKGYLIYKHKPLYSRFTFMFEKNPAFTTADAYYKYLISHGYLKLTVNTREVRDMDAVIACDRPMYPIPIEIELYKGILNKTTLQMMYGYPYFDLRKNKSLLLFRYST